MKLTHLHFEKYKAFEAAHDLEIRPLTILIGPNNSGKSAIARLPLLLERGFSGQTQAPIDLEFDGLDFGGYFRELVYNQSPRNYLKIGLSFVGDDSNRWKVVVGIQGFDEYHMQIVESFELFLNGEKSPLSAKWVGKDPKLEPWLYEHGKIGEKLPVQFYGLLPSISMDNMPIDQFLFRNLKINYLGPFRDQPQRIYRFSGGQPTGVGPGGRQAPQMLAHETTSKERKILDNVGEWFYKHLGGWTLDVEKEGIGFSLVLVNPHNSAVKVNLKDAGTGISQVLPMVVQRMFDSLHGSASTLEVVEQPELHLHPQAHGDLADLYITACKQIYGQFLIETHSELFLLRLRRRIAEGKLNPNDVIMYWIRGDDQKDKIMPIHIDENGETNTWPTDVFSDAYKEITAIRRAQKKRKKEQ